MLFVFSFKFIGVLNVGVGRYLLRVIKFLKWRLRTKNIQIGRH